MFGKEATAMPWLLTVVLLFVSATGAFAQWQTRVDVIVYSLADSDYLGELRLARDAAQKRGDHTGVAKMNFLLSQQSDPTGYKGFTTTLKKRILYWSGGKVAKGKDSPIYGKMVSVLMAPYAMSPTPGDVQVTMVFRTTGDDSLVITRSASLKIKDGVEKSFEFLKLMILAPPVPDPSMMQTSTKRSA